MKNYIRHILTLIICLTLSLQAQAQAKPKRDVTMDNKETVQQKQTATNKKEQGKTATTKKESSAKKESTAKKESSSKKESEKSKKQSTTKKDTTSVDGNGTRNVLMRKEDFGINKPNVIFAQEGGSDTLYVSGTEDWTYSILPNRTWASIITDGNKLTLSVVPNNSTIPRTDYFEIASGKEKIRINIEQLGLPYTEEAQAAQNTTATTSGNAKDLAAEMAAAKKAEQEAKARQKQLIEEQKRAEELAKAEKKRAAELAKAEQKRAEELAKAEQKRAEELAKAEQKRAEELAKAEQKKAEELAKAEQKRAAELALAERKKAEEAARAEKLKAEEEAKAKLAAEKKAKEEQERAAQLAKAEQKRAEELAKAEQKRAEELAKAEQKRAEELAKAEQKRAEELAKAEQKKAEELAKAEQQKALEASRLQQKNIASEAVAKQTDTADRKFAQWVKEYMQIGLNIATLDYQLTGESGLSYHIGPRLRFGKAKHTVNAIAGIDYGVQQGSVEGANKKVADQLILMGEARWNAIHTNEINMFGGLAIELQFNFPCNGANCHKESLAFTPKLGISTKHLDMGLELRLYVKDHGVIYSQPNDVRIGGFVSWYF